MQFLNVLGCEFVIRLALAAEWIGICHFSWLLYYGTSALMCSKVRRIQKEIDESEKTSDAMLENDAMSPTERIRGPNFDTGIKKSDEFTWFDYPRFLWSTCTTLGALGVIIYGISLGVYVLPVPIIAAYLIAIVTMTVLFYLEGLMIAIVGTQYWDPEQFREAYPRAYEMHKFVNQPDNVKRFIIGRQFFTVLTNFLLAQVSSDVSLHPSPFTLLASLVHLFFRFPVYLSRFMRSSAFSHNFTTHYSLPALLHFFSPLFSTSLHFFPPLFSTSLYFSPPQIFTFKYWEAGDFNPILFFILIKSGLVGVLNILAFGQLLPELLAAQYPLRFMNMYGACSVVYISQFFDMMGVGHCAWAMYYITRGLFCAKHYDADAEGRADKSTKPELIKVQSAEILAAQA